MSHPRYPPLQPPATNRGRSALLALAVVLGLSLSACALPPPASPGSGPGAEALADKPRIAKAADLPRFAYPVAGPLEDMVRSAERFAPRKVQVQPLDAQRSLVTSGLTAGERVVTQGATLLAQIR